MSKNKHLKNHSPIKRNTDRVITPPPHQQLIEDLLIVGFICGLVLIFWEIEIYEVTLIPFNIPFFIWVVTGLVITPFFKKVIKLYLKMSFFIMQAIIASVLFGSITCCTFMLVNQHYAYGPETTTTTKVISSGHMGKNGVPYVIVHYGNQDKQLIFTGTADIGQYKYVDLTLRRGFFGYDVIITKYLHN